MTIINCSNRSAELLLVTLTYVVADCSRFIAGVLVRTIWTLDLLLMFEGLLVRCLPEKRLLLTGVWFDGLIFCNFLNLILRFLRFEIYLLLFVGCLV